MNALWRQMFKSAYRREPIVSFIITVGVVDAMIGGIGASWSLLSFGLGTVGVAVAVRWWQSPGSKVESPEAAPEYYLPSSSSRPPLPMLNPKHKRPPF
jgi:hypothetical protein